MNSKKRLLRPLMLCLATLLMATCLCVCLTACTGFGSHEHTYGEYTYNNDATCGRDGTQSAACTKCGRVNTIEAYDTATGEHQFLRYVYNNDATCREDGTETAKCENCTKTDTRVKEGSSLDGEHEYEDYICTLCYDLDPDAPYTEGLQYNSLLNFWGGTAFGYSVTKGNAGDIKYLKFPSHFNGEPVLEIEDEAFKDCQSLRWIELPDTVDTIGDHAFEKCGLIYGVKLSEKLTIIGDYAFSGCHFQNNTIEFPATLQKIGNYAFSLSNLHKIEIPDGVTSIGAGAFKDNEYLKDVSLPDSLVFVGGGAFNYNYDALRYLNYYEDSDGSKYLGNSENPYVMLMSAELTSNTFSIKPGTRIIYNSAFPSNSPLTNITIPDTVRYFGIAFASCKNLTSVTLPNNLSSIADYAFSDCTSLRDITIPIGISSIGEGAFYNCTNLVSLTIPLSVAVMGDKAFENDKALTLYCEAASKPVGWSENWAYSERYVIWNCNKNDQSSSGHSYTYYSGVRYALKDGEASVEVQPAVHSANITIPSTIAYKGDRYTVTTIVDSAYSRRSTLEKITIPNTVTTIKEYAFTHSTGLKSVSFAANSNLQTIEKRAFDQCTALTSITIPKSVSAIGRWAFCGCTDLKTVYIPIGVTNIEWTAFYDCGNVTIYCWDSQRPSSWHSDWNGGCNVVWEYRD